MAVTSCPEESAVVRTWGRANGFTVGERGLLPQAVRDAWVAAGGPWPEGSPPPEGWVLIDFIPDFNPRSGTPGSLGKVKRSGKGRARGRVSQTTPITPEQVDRMRSYADMQEAIGVEGPEPHTSPHAGPPIPSGKFVDLVSGGAAEVLTQAEVDWFNSARTRYMAQARFTDHTDLADLDRLLGMELLLYRWNQWVMSGSDYDNRRIDDMELAKKIREASTAISALKDNMGLSKKSRDAGASSVSEKWADLLRRARAFGYAREEQTRAALLLMNELSAIVESYHRSDDEERRKLGFPDEHSIVEWVRTNALPRFREVDAHFRANVVSTWVRN